MEDARALVFSVPLRALAASPATSSEASGSDDAERASKKRKPTYLVRKEEKHALESEMEALRAQLEVLKARNGQVDGHMQRAAAENRVLHEVARHQQLALARSQAMMSQCLGEQRTFPLYTHIRLGSDWAERRRVLGEIKPLKLVNAVRYVNERSASLDMLKPHLSDERFEDSEGGYCCIRFEVIQFEGVESLKQVYDALHFYFINMEISISERLGHTTVREDYTLGDSSMANFRMISDDESGVSTEINSVSFGHMFENPDVPGEHMGVFISDCVDVDELYPYDPEKHVRKDISGTVVITAHRRRRPQGQKSTNGESLEEGELVVVMRRGAFLRLHRPHFEVPPIVLVEMRERVSNWGDVMLKTVRDLVYPRD